ncbi:MAG: DUF1127 domain-containing protein [Rhodobacteraceae bacterium]|nr:DUF1127 domain-containing protein [Paracoccaceae bacterium]
MAIIDNTRTVPLGAVTTFRVVNFFSNAYDALVSLRKARKTSKVLSGLSTRQLEDIGLMPADIYAVSKRVSTTY